jgi:hypothetical protein
MQNPSKLHVGATVTAPPLDCVAQLREDWRLVQSAHREPLLKAMSRMNLLVVGRESVIQSILDLLRPTLEEPLTTWRPGEPLLLPPVAQGGTVILRDVGSLTHGDQRRLLDWSQHAVGQIQLVSTAAAPLFPRVKNGTFIDALYYRLNTMYVDGTQ